MNLTFLNNIIAHPATSIAGILSATTTLCGFLAQQGIMGPHVGSGTATAVTFAGALATVLLGLFAKDPNAQTR